MKLTQASSLGKTNNRRKIRRYLRDAITVSTLFIGTQYLLLEMECR